MARKITRKSNKTSHVLNLLTSDPKRSEPAVEPSVDLSFEPDPTPEETLSPPMQPTPAPSDTGNADPTDTAQVTEPVFPEFEPDHTPATPTRRRASSRKSTAPTSSNSMMDLSQALEERISQQIHDSLSAKLAEYEAQDAKRLEEERKRAERIAAEAGLSVESVPEEATAEDPAPEDDPMPEAAPEPAQDTQPATKAHSEEDFEIVNVMEVMLDGFQQEFMDKFGMCTCRRCWLDTRALTLSSVPAKYVVLTHDTVNAMMNFYEHRYRGMLMAQLTQSCMKVMQNPHH